MVVGLGRTPETYSSQQLNLGSRWVRMGHAVDLLTGRQDGLARAAEAEGLRLRPLRSVSVGVLRLVAGLRRRLREGDYDLVVSSEHYQPATAACCLAGRNVVIYQGQNAPGARPVSRAALGLLERTCGRLSLSRCLCAVAKTTAAAELLRRQGAKRVLVAPCGYDERRFRPPRGPERTEARRQFAVQPPQRALVYAGNLLARRDVGTAIRALADLAGRGHDAVLLVAGDGPERPRLESLASELDLSDRTRFLGHLPWKALRRAYWAGDLLVFPSRYEVFGMVLVEAMGCGLVPASTPVPAARDVLTDGRNGVVFACGDHGGLAESCDHIFRTEGLLAGLREAALRSAEALTWTRVAERMMAFAESQLAPSVSGEPALS
jgi:glycosyltransferase involved in cell wall biosynthesis